MKKVKKEKNDQKVTNGLVKFWVIGGIAVLSLGVIGAAVAGIHRAIVESQKDKIYSVVFDTSSNNPKGTRADSAKGMVAGINGEKNDFDNAYPWKSIKEVKDEQGNVFVRIPKFYERFEENEETSKMTVSVSAHPHKGFHVAPAFLKGDETIDYIDIGKYEASLKDGHLKSVSGEMPETAGHTLDQYRAVAEADGNQLFDWRGHQALQTLFSVEFANMDSQSVMAGETEYLCYCPTLSAEDIAKGKMSEFAVESIDEQMIIDPETDVIKFAKANLSHVDIAYDYTNDDDETVSVTKTVSASVELNSDEDEIVKIKLSEELDISKMEEDSCVNIAFGSYNIHKTGSSDGRKGSSSGASMKSLEVTSMNYRGIENWYGNTYTWCDGLATYKDENNVEFKCVSLDATKNSNRDSYKRYASDAELLQDGILFQEFNMSSEECEWLKDYFNFSYASEAYRIGFVGGNFDNGCNAGAFFLSVSDDVSFARNSVRLSCIPQAR